MISELIGIPREFRKRLHELSDRIAAREEGMQLPEDTYAASAELWALLETLISGRRENPGDDVITMLMNTEVQEHVHERERGRRPCEQ